MTNKPKTKQASETKDLFRRREPFNFMLWSAITGISIMFLALTAIYLFRKGQNEVALPSIFWLSTCCITLSSFSLWRVNITIKKERFRQAKFYLGATLGLGLLFIGLQVIGWQQMLAMKIYLSNSIVGSFIYLISGLHIAHILGGIIFLALV